MIIVFIFALVLMIILSILYLKSLNGADRKTKYIPLMVLCLAILITINYIENLSQSKQLIDIYDHIGIMTEGVVNGICNGIITYLGDTPEKVTDISKIVRTAVNSLNEINNKINSLNIMTNGMDNKIDYILPMSPTVNQYFDYIIKQIEELKINIGGLR